MHMGSKNELYRRDLKTCDLHNVNHLNHWNNLTWVCPSSLSMIKLTWLKLQTYFMWLKWKPHSFWLNRCFTFVYFILVTCLKTQSKIAYYYGSIYNSGILSFLQWLQPSIFNFVLWANVRRVESLLYFLLIHMLTKASANPYLWIVVATSHQELLTQLSILHSGTMTPRATSY